MKNTIWLVVFAAVIILVLVFVSKTATKPPFIPADDLHKVITTDAACTECHAPGKRSPLKPSHPPKEQCLYCHKVK